MHYVIAITYWAVNQNEIRVDFACALNHLFTSKLIMLATSLSSWVIDLQPNLKTMKMSIRRYLDWMKIWVLSSWWLSISFFYLDVVGLHFQHMFYFWQNVTQQFISSHTQIVSKVIKCSCRITIAYLSSIN